MNPAFCADLHKGKEGHPAADHTPGFAAEKARREAMGQKVYCLGDMNELLQFSEKEIGTLEHTDVAGNHDKGTAPKELEIVTERGLTICLHGNRFDPWFMKVAGPLGAKCSVCY